MKHLLLLLSLLLATTSLQAQNADFAPVGARWIYNGQDFALQGVPYIMEVTGKENFEGKWCSRFDYFPDSSDKLYLYTENDTVFFYSFLSEQFEMLYDFTAEVGDSWVIGGLEGYHPDNPLPYAFDTITIDSISNLYISGDTLKVWHISNSFWFDWGDRIIEKVGNDGFLLPRFGLFETSVWGLRCFETSDQFFQFVPYPCDTIFSTTITTSAPEEVLNIQVSPNPFQERMQITVQPLQSAHHFLLFNPMGILILRKEFEGSFDIETSALPFGIYHWTVEKEGRMLGRGSCIKTD